MATDFKTPEKFVFDHSENKQSDKLRQLLGLIYKTEEKGTFLKPFIDFTQVIGGGDVPKFVVSRNQNKFGGSDMDIDQINAAETILIKTIENYINQVNNPDGENNSQFFEDFNFKIDKNLLKNFSVQTVVRDLQESDIQEGNSDYPGGELNPKKKETSLKFAYAFETIKIQGEEQIVAKKVKLVNGADDLIKRASNENNNDLEIKQLQNLFYITPQDDEMNAQIIGEGSESNFDLDKIYNIIKIDLAAIKDPKETQNSIYSFSPYPGSPAINGFAGIEDLSGLERQGIDTYKFLKYVTDKINQSKALERQYLPENGFNLFGYGIPVDPGSSIYYNLSFENPLSIQLEADSNSLKNAFSKIKALTTFYNLDFNNNIVEGNQGNILLDACLSLPLKPFYQLINVTNKFWLKTAEPTLRNYTEADLFRSAQKTNGKFVFSFGQRNDNLLRPAFPVGLRLVKSTEPYDPDKTNLFNNSILQTFYIPLEANPNENQIRLFDSQIIYGKTYYYTLFGIYYVDGKFYFYPYIEVNKDFVKESETISKSKESITVKQSGLELFKNPCCEFNALMGNFYDIFLKPFRAYSVSALGVEAEARKISSQAFVPPLATGVSGDQLKKIEILAELGFRFGYAFFEGKGYDYWNNYYSILDPKLKDAFECYVCRKPKVMEFIWQVADGQWSGNSKYDPYSKGDEPVKFINKADKKLGVKYKEKEIELVSNDTKKSPIINCTKFGWPTPWGNNPSLENYIDKAFSIGSYADTSTPGNDTIAVEKQIVNGKVQSETTSNNSVTDKCYAITTVKEIKGSEKFKDFKFKLFESNARRTYEIPLLPSLENSVVSLIPLPPIVEFVPLADINNRIKIKFQESAASGFIKVQVDEAVKILNGGATYQKIDKRSKEEADLNGLVLDEQELLARSEGDIKEIYAFKLDRVPTSLQDLIDNGERLVLDYKSGKTAYFSNVLPNEKYYYTFVSRDVTGLFSTATETFQVEIVEDSGYVYTKIDLYDYVTKEIKVTTKEFQKLLKIKPSFKEMLPADDGNIGTTDLYSTIKAGLTYGPDHQPPKFKIRIKSKKTNRVFDINLKYSQDIKEITSKKLIEQLKKVSELVDQKKVKKNN